jgi:rRNA maturation RNase YbeY
VNGELTVRNRQRSRPVNTPRLRRVIQSLLERELACHGYQLDIHVVGEGMMTRLNEKHLRHGGCTDVIAFDYSGEPNPDRLHGEIFVCAPEAERQAARYRTSRPDELVRYIIHGTLHLRGYDDHAPAARRRMKREEDRLLRRLSRRFDFSALARTTDR